MKIIKVKSTKTNHTHFPESSDQKKKYVCYRVYIDYFTSCKQFAIDRGDLGLDFHEDFVEVSYFKIMSHPIQT